MSKKPSPSKRRLRSTEWFGRHDRDGLVHRSWMKNQGIPHDQFDGRPVIGICNTWSQATPCNAHFRELAQHVRDGILDSGGFPIEFPVMSLGETLMRPTTMLFRNQVAMDVEESIRANPFDRIVEMVNEDLKMSKILTRDAFENAIMVNGAIGGSTNAVVHLLAIAGRIGVKLTLDDWDRLGHDIPCLVNLMPSGKYLMEDFYYAGGLPVVIKEIGKFLHKKALTVNGSTIWDNSKNAVNYNEAV